MFIFWEAVILEGKKKKRNKKKKGEEKNEINGKWGQDIPVTGSDLKIHNISGRNQPVSPH